MGGEYVEKVSLCYVSSKTDWKGDHWLRRMADVEDGMLVTPKKTPSTSIYFENRELVVWYDGPTEVGSVGIWEWTATPLKDRPQIDRVNSWYAHEYRPIYVMVLPDAKSIQSIVENLKKGVTRPPLDYDFYVCFEQSMGLYNGVLCSWRDLVARDTLVKLKDGVYTLPQYKLTSNDILLWRDGTYTYRFLKKLFIDIPKEYARTGNTNDIIRELILKQISWNAYKEMMPGTQNEWRRCKALLEKVCGETVYDIVAGALRITPEQSKSAVNAFIKQTNQVIDRGDIDAELLAAIIRHNESLRTECEEIAAKQWKKDHQNEIIRAQEDLQAIKQQVKAEEQHKESLSTQILDFQRKLEDLKADIVKYEALGDSASQSIRKKIEAARKDMGAFLAELAIYMPMETQQRTVKENGWCYIPGIAMNIEPTDICSHWDDLTSILQGNLQTVFSVNSYLAQMLSAFLYSACIRKTPLLLAGPYATEIADSISVSVFGRSAGALEIGTGLDREIITQVDEGEDSVVIVRNMFQVGGGENLLQALSLSRKFIVCVRPYAEDLQIEPEGLYNYVIPVFTECFVEVPPKSDFISGRMSDGFEQYTASTCRPIPASHPLLKKLKLSKLLENRLQGILSDTAAMTGIRSKDVEYLLGLLPLALLKGKTEFLKESLQAEKGLSNVVKDTIQRYLDED